MSPLFNAFLSYYSLLTTQWYPLEYFWNPNRPVIDEFCLISEITLGLFCGAVYNKPNNTHPLIIFVGTWCLTLCS